ncbi:MAG: TIM barrel protein [Verrucomicrobia bacterium]|nr:TIM barrel protein [Verrucomicrobiota bacterium]
MKLLLIRHLWGVTGNLEELLPQFRELGFDGIEAALPALKERRQWRRLLRQHQFDFIPQIFTAGTSVAAHIESFRRQMGEAAGMSPVFINAHSGLDAWSESDSSRFFEAALAVEQTEGIRIAHETHRGRILFNPWITSRLLDRFERLKLCCDFSHWVCVGERLIDDQIDIIRQSAARCLHLHARVGYEQGPQVPDPRAPEYAAHLAAHERWWRLVWDAQKKRGDKTSTLTPEFGPPGYLHTLPFTNAPVSNLWDICHWQANRQKDNFAAWRKSRS